MATSSTGSPPRWSVSGPPSKAAGPGLSTGNSVSASTRSFVKVSGRKLSLSEGPSVTSSSPVKQATSSRSTSASALEQTRLGSFPATGAVNIPSFARPTKTSASRTQHSPRPVKTPPRSDLRPLASSPPRSGSTARQASSPKASVTSPKHQVSPRTLDKANANAAPLTRTATTTAAAPPVKTQGSPNFLTAPKWQYGSSIPLPAVAKNVETRRITKARRYADEHAVQPGRLDSAMKTVGSLPSQVFTSMLEGLQENEEESEDTDEPVPLIKETIQPALKQEAPFVHDGDEDEDLEVLRRIRDKFSKVIVDDTDQDIYSLSSMVFRRIKSPDLNPDAYPAVYGELMRSLGGLASLVEEVNQAFGLDDDKTKAASAPIAPLMTERIDTVVDSGNVDGGVVSVVPLAKDEVLRRVDAVHVLNPASTFTFSSFESVHCIVKQACFPTESLDMDPTATKEEDGSKRLRHVHFVAGFAFVPDESLFVAALRPPVFALASALVHPRKTTVGSLKAAVLSQRALWRRKPIREGLEGEKRVSAIATDEALHQGVVKQADAARIFTKGHVRPSTLDIHPGSTAEYGCIGDVTEQDISESALQSERALTPVETDKHISTMGEQRAKKAAPTPRLVEGIISLPSEDIATAKYFLSTSELVLGDHQGSSRCMIQLHHSQSNHTSGPTLNDPRPASIEDDSPPRSTSSGSGLSQPTSQPGFWTRLFSRSSPGSSSLTARSLPPDALEAYCGDKTRCQDSLVPAFSAASAAAALSSASRISEDRDEPDASDSSFASTQYTASSMPSPTVPTSRFSSASSIRLPLPDSESSRFSPIKSFFRRLF
ncbi:predicted protein [Postia placenta Mad-698-R]|uniref:Uncharacterized protein n=1 Tax=Postia placenta MAD-698-R-SB12 TaxID=670580 RepID=A0A1X6MS73_9APHY|nr:hypothetical protein POSPLADRAFT_1152107 [Postia placenta MAD-698-R-SB12]EED79102.1 predicted protein [Postia placenta Mad-698-R]OSX59139.1 hypothetical protein POSPLADRAFT_1152107 [Postia placenta MAD-698-R-SB12]